MLMFITVLGNIESSGLSINDRVLINELKYAREAKDTLILAEAYTLKEKEFNKLLSKKIETENKEEKLLFEDFSNFLNSLPNSEKDWEGYKKKTADYFRSLGEYSSKENYLSRLQKAKVGLSTLFFGIRDANEISTFLSSLDKEISELREKEAAAQAKLKAEEEAKFEKSRLIRMSPEEFTRYIGYDQISRQDREEGLSDLQKEGNRNFYANRLKEFSPDKKRTVYNWKLNISR